MTIRKWELFVAITSDLFDITELLHHGPEDIVISIIKLLGSFIILLNINVKLTIVSIYLCTGHDNLCRIL